MRGDIVKVSADSPWATVTRICDVTLPEGAHAVEIEVDTGRWTRIRGLWSQEHLRHIVEESHTVTIATKENGDPANA